MHEIVIFILNLKKQTEEEKRRNLWERIKKTIDYQAKENEVEEDER